MIEVFTPENGDPILVDLVGDFQVERSAELTDYPVEDGTSRTDHKIINPDTVTITIKQTETPIDDPQFALLPISFETAQNRTKVTSPFLLAGALLDKGIGAVASALGFADPPVQSLAYQTLSPRDRGGELWDKLSALLDSPDLCSVSFKGRSVASLSVIGVSKTDSTGEGALSTFQVSLRQLREMSLTSVALPNPADLIMKPPKVLGKAAAVEVPAEDVPAPSKSVLLASLQGLGVPL